MRERSTARQRCTVVPHWADELPFLRVIGGPVQGLELALSRGTPLVVGRGAGADLWIPDAAVSRRHCRLVLVERELLVQDLGSRNGLHLNSEPIREGRVTESDRLHIAGETVVRLVHMTAAEAAEHDELVFAATRDSLTRVYNRGYFEQQLEVELSFARRHGTPLSVLLLDLDQLKQINDELGHEAGDVALTRFADRIRSMIRREDLFARVGGDEFAIVARGIDERQAHDFADRLCSTLDGGSVSYRGHRITIAASIGVATTPPAVVDTGADLVRIADVSMYRAKRERREGRPSVGRVTRARPTLRVVTLA